MPNRRDNGLDSHVILSCSSTPPKRLPPQLAASPDVLGRLFKAIEKSTSLELPGPSAFPDPATLLFTPLEASKVFCPPPWKSHLQGLATLWVALARSILGDLFQSPTLLGFALQSFLPLSWSKKSFPSLSPFPRFLPKPPGLGSAPQRLVPTRKAVPLFASRRISSGQGLLLSWAF